MFKTCPKCRYPKCWQKAPFCERCSHPFRILSLPVVNLVKPAPTPDLTLYHWIVVNSSAGKDSQAMLDYVVEEADKVGVRDRIIVVHADLGRCEWPGTKEIAQRQAQHYNVRFKAVRRKLGDLLQQIEERGMFPSPAVRWCTSYQKRDQISKVITSLSRWTLDNEEGVDHVRILNCIGIRADESIQRAKKNPFRQSSQNARRTVDNWLPLFAWTVDDVWERIGKAQTEVHYVYQKYGLPRCSCCFCIFASWDALVLAGHYNLPLLKAYVRVEKKIGHQFRTDFSLAAVLRAVKRGEKPKQVADWAM